LFAIRIVASNSFGLLSSSRMRLPFTEFSRFSPSVSFGESEKKADSALETIAESNNRNKTITRIIMMLVSGLTISILKITEGGSMLSI